MVKFTRLEVVIAVTNYIPIVLDVTHTGSKLLTLYRNVLPPPSNLKTKAVHYATLSTNFYQSI